MHQGVFFLLALRLMAWSSPVQSVTLPRGPSRVTHQPITSTVANEQRSGALHEGSQLVPERVLPMPTITAHRRGRRSREGIPADLPSGEC